MFIQKYMYIVDFLMDNIFFLFLKMFLEIICFLFDKIIVVYSNFKKFQYKKLFRNINFFGRLKQD